MTTDESAHSGRDESAAVAEIQHLAGLFDAHPEFGAAEARHFVASYAGGDSRRFNAPPATAVQGDLQATFSAIYAGDVWRGGSGAGSHPNNVLLYAAYVQHLVRRPGVRRIVDLGCGDWQFSKHLDFGASEYLGVDIVPTVIERNAARYASARIRFVRTDITAFEIPACDLLLCKDVLQHLSNVHVGAVLARCRAAETALITNDFHAVNQDCADGGTRPLDPTALPFSFKAQPRLAFEGKVAFLARRQGAAGVFGA